MRMIIVSLAMLLGLAVQAVAEAPMRVVSVVGEGQVAAVPDMAIISLGVTHDAKTAQTAMEQVNIDVAALLTALAGLKVDARDVQTDQLSVSPIWSDSVKSRRIIGFVARNTLSVRVRNLDKLGPVLDAALAAGSNTFNGVQFTLQDPSEQEAQARADAVRDGMAKAAQLAQAANATLGQIITLSEQGGVGQPKMMMATARRDSMAIATGEVSVSARVSITFDLIP